MVSDRAKIESVKPHLREIYAGDLAGLTAYRRQIFGEATETVTLTQGSFEGGTGSGQVTFEKSLLLIAINEVLAESVNGGTRRSRVILPDYRFSSPV